MITSGAGAIAFNFAYHAPNDGIADKHAAVRKKAEELALLINKAVPEHRARERATAITKVEEAMFWACAGICRS